MPPRRKLDRGPERIKPVMSGPRSAAALAFTRRSTCRHILGWLIVVPFDADDWENNDRRGLPLPAFPRRDWRAAPHVGKCDDRAHIGSPAVPPEDQAARWALRIGFLFI